VAIAPDGTWLATMHNSPREQAVRIWDTATGAVRTTLNSRKAQVAAVAIAPDGARLVTVGADGTLRIWDRASSSIIAVTRADSPLKDCAWSPSGCLLAAAGNSGIYLYILTPDYPQGPDRRS
jgi:WD40 repeat protein